MSRAGFKKEKRAMSIFFKKKRRRGRPPHEKGPLKRILLGMLILLLCAGVLTGFWFLSQLGPREVGENASRGNPEAGKTIPDEIRALREESVRLEEEFSEVVAVRDPEEEDLELLEEAIERQREYVEELPRASRSQGRQRLNELENQLNNLRADDLLERSRRLENEARALNQEEKYEEAQERYAEAHRLQREINEDFPEASAADIARAARLRRQARYLAAEPVYLESRELEKKAVQWSEEEEWDKAEEAISEAISLQDRLNREFTGSNRADGARLERLREKRMGIRTGQDNLEIDRIENEGDAKRVEGEHLEAARLYAEAARLQEELNEEFPDSPNASEARMEELQRKAQTAQSYELGREIERNQERLNRLLAERKTHRASEVIVALREDLEEMGERYRKSSLNDEDLQRKVEYLHAMQSDIGFIQDRVYDSVLPVPDFPEWRMLRTEVTQALYSMVMGSNPSRTSGDTRPVDSVSWNEANSFCRRLSWIMGREVRLPSEEIFRKALGPLKNVVLEDKVWSADNSDGTAQPVAGKEPFQNGFYDLLGNVSEWLEPSDPEETDMVRHIGGHAQDRLDAIFSVPLRSVDPGERNRMTGFRFIMRAD